MKKIDTAMILAAGFGKRMGRITGNTPKPLLKIGEFTLIDFQLKKLARAGIKKVVINLHFKAAKIMNYLQKNPPKNLEVMYSSEPQILGTGGGIANAAQFFGQETILVVNSDILSNLSLTNFFKFYEQTEKFAAITIWPSRDYKNYSLVEFNHDNILLRFHPKNSPPARSAKTGIFMGYYILSYEARKYLEPIYSSVVDKLFVRALEKDIFIDVYSHHGAWIDVGTRENYQRLINLYQKGEFDPATIIS